MPVVLGKSPEQFGGGSGDSEPAFSSDRLSGWAGIEDHLVKNDTGVVKDYADDIDTLLVFAGLFSAVLTAFVVETYTLLQPDSSATTNQLLAYQVSSQVPTAHIPSAINTTISSFINAGSFIPSTSARWINVSLFLSLTLSLAAAFFGILAKQWLREYMRWNSPLGSPRENVLVRQIRFEAWESWNLAATISTIPALLEIAMILFLIGVVILLWTLDNVVAIVVTISVLLFLSAAVAFTILPLFYRKCPYKSPTAWAFSVTLDFLRASWRYGLYRGKNIVNDCDWPRPKTWRERDVNICRMTTQTGRAAAKRELLEEINHIGDGIQPTMITSAVVKSSDAYADELLRDIEETGFLVRALLWVQKASQDTRVAKYADQCLESLHLNQTQETIRSSSILAVWSIFLAIEGNHLSTPQSTLWRTGESSEIPSQITALRRSLNVEAHVPTILDSDLIKYRISGYGPTGVGPYLIQRATCTEAQLSAHSLLFRILVVHLRTRAARLHDLLQSHGLGSHTVALHIRRMIETFQAIRSLGSDLDLLSTEWYREALRSILCHRELNDALDTTAPGFRADVFRRAGGYVRLTVDEEHLRLVILEGKTTRADAEALLQCFHRTIDLVWGKEDDFEIFVTTAMAWLSLSIREEHCQIDSSSETIFSIMTEALEAVPNRFSNMSRAGHCILDPWWAAEFEEYLQGCVEINGNRAAQSLTHAFLDAYNYLVSRSSTHNRRGVHPATTLRIVHECMLRTHHGPRVTCGVDEKCPWIHHSCESSRTCELLIQPGEPKASQEPPTQTKLQSVLLRPAPHLPEKLHSTEHGSPALRVPRPKVLQRLAREFSAMFRRQQLTTPATMLNDIENALEPSPRSSLSDSPWSISVVEATDDGTGDGFELNVTEEPRESSLIEDQEDHWRNTALQVDYPSRGFVPVWLRRRNTISDASSNSDSAMEDGSHEVSVDEGRGEASLHISHQGPASFTGDEYGLLPPLFLETSQSASHLTATQTAEGTTPRLEQSNLDTMSSLGGRGRAPLSSAVAWVSEAEF